MMIDSVDVCHQLQNLSISAFQFNFSHISYLYNVLENCYLRDVDMRLVNVFIFICFFIKALLLHSSFFLY